MDFNVDALCTALAAMILMAYAWRRLATARDHGEFFATRLPERERCPFPDHYAAATSAALASLSRNATLCENTTWNISACTGPAPSGHGMGLIATTNLSCGTVVGVMLDNVVKLSRESNNNKFNNLAKVLHHFVPRVTPLASKINHCATRPNVRIVPEQLRSAGVLEKNGSPTGSLQTRKNTGRWIGITIDKVAQHQELVADYNDQPWYIWQPLPWWAC